MKSGLAIMKLRLATVPCRYYDGTPCNIWYLEDKQAVCFLIECC